MESIKDHLGKEYNSVNDMCKAYGIKYSTFKNRLRNGWALEDALVAPLNTAMIAGKKCVDHLGNEFKSIKEMCAANNIPYTLYFSRVKCGMSLEDIFTKPQMSIEMHSGKKCKDHLGNEYESISKMCRTYSIHRYTFYRRRLSGWSLEDALTTPVCETSASRSKVCTDHLGNKYASKIKMCDAYDLDIKTYQSRIKAGWTLERALTTPVDRECKDHLGNVYNTKKDMCEAYNIDYNTFSERINLGWSLERALITPIGKKGQSTRKECVDHLGNKYESITAMCEAYNVDANLFRSRIKHGWDLEKALKDNNKRDHKDHLGNVYKSFKKMCNAYGLGEDKVKSRLDAGWSLEKALTTNTKYKDHLGNEYKSIVEMCNAYGIDRNVYYERLKRNWSVEDALTIPLGGKNESIRRCKDHLGNEYTSVGDMCNYYNINRSTYENRLERGMSLEDALTAPLYKHS